MGTLTTRPVVRVSARPTGATVIAAADIPLTATTGPGSSNSFVCVGESTSLSGSIALTAAVVAANSTTGATLTAGNAPNYFLLVEDIGT